MAPSDYLDLMPCGNEPSNQVDGVILHAPDAVNVSRNGDDADPHAQVQRAPTLDSAYGVLFRCRWS